MNYSNFRMINYMKNYTIYSKTVTHLPPPLPSSAYGRHAAPPSVGLVYTNPSTAASAASRASYGPDGWRVPLPERMLLLLSAGE